MKIRAAHSKASWLLSGVAFFLAATFTGAAPSASETDAPAEDIPHLEHRVADFLHRWLTDKDPVRATADHLSAKVNNDNLLPTELGTIRNRRSRPANRRIRNLSPQAARSRMEGFLSEMFDIGERSRQSHVVPTLLPFCYDRDAEIVDLLKNRNIDINTFRTPHWGYFRVTQWDDISWSASGVPAHHSISPSYLQKQGITNMYAVVGRIRIAPQFNDSVLTLMLWVNEAPGKREWKLWGVIPVPTE